MINNSTIVLEAVDTLNLLVVEDSKQWRYNHAEMFGELGFNVLRFGGIPGVSGRDGALRALLNPETNEKVDIVFLDLVMDNMVFDDVPDWLLDVEKENGDNEIPEGVKLLEMFKGDAYETIGRPIFIIYSTFLNKFQKEIQEKFPDMVYGYLSKGVTDIEVIKDIVRKAIRKSPKYSYFEFE